jgi:hypothetical protein
MLQSQEFLIIKVTKTTDLQFSQSVIFDTVQVCAFSVKKKAQFPPVSNIAFVFGCEMQMPSSHTQCGKHNTERPFTL